MVLRVGGEGVDVGCGDGSGSVGGEDCDVVGVYGMGRGSKVKDSLFAGYGVVMAFYLMVAFGVGLFRAWW